MDWTTAISRNRTALLAVAAAIAALIGGREGEGRIARGVRNAALALLRPAEAALRRLIVIAARGLTAAPRPPRPPLTRPVRRAADGGRVPAFRLADGVKRFGRRRRMRPNGVPRIRTFWGPQHAATPPRPVAAPIDPHAPVNVRRLRLRLLSLEMALADLPRQARRLARWRAKWAARPIAPGALPRAPMRLGHPPGWRLSSGRDIDDVLRDCHALALDAWAPDAWAQAPPPQAGAFT
jgi:hypothetical protein